MPRGTSRRTDPVYARQGTGTKVHVVPADRYLLTDMGSARCGKDTYGPEYPARLVPPNDRCQSPACKTAWPALLRAVG